MKSADVLPSRPRRWTRPWLTVSSLALTLIVLALLSSGCASVSPMNRLAPGVKPAEIPPLPQAGRQPRRSEKFSATVSRDIESWEKKLTGRETPDLPASEPTTRFPRPPDDPNL